MYKIARDLPGVHRYNFALMAEGSKFKGQRLKLIDSIGEDKRESNFPGNARC